jgi:hypothetical protein
VAGPSDSADLPALLLLHVPGGTGPLTLLLMVKFRQPSHEFTFGVGMSFISYPLVLTPLV